MLESMIKSPLPTRAEVTDVAYAARIGTDSTMLSGETAAGKHPFDALRIMGEILEVAEKRMPFISAVSPAHNEHEAQAAAAVSMAQTIDAPVIVLFTHSGATARAVSKLRPGVPVIAFTDHADIARKMQILFGIYPMVIPFDQKPEKTVATAFKKIRSDFDFAPGSPVVVLSSINDSGHTVHTVQSRLLP
jgi:pyruvate kinase